MKSALSDALAGRYTLNRELGQGGMATVYLAQDCRHERPVALKVLNKEKSAALGAERFEREIKLLARLRHPFVLPLHDSGEAAGELYFVMPYIDGESLRARLQREGALSLDDTVKIVRQIADAIDYAHGEGVVHRDIKPENILLSRHGHALLADFGIARGALLAQQSDPSLTEVGVAIGTAAYMSPEQALGDHNVDSSTDVYSLGCVVYEMLAGHPPFVGATALALVAQHVGAPAPKLTAARNAVTDSAAHAVARALAKAPQARFPTATEFAEALITTAARQEGAIPSLASPQRLSIAVLPMSNRSPDAETEFFSDGMTEELINALAKVDGLRVVSRTSTFAFKGESIPLGEIGTRLNVGFVLEASVRRAANRLRVTARLVEVADDSTVWSETYERQLEDVFAVQDEITHSIVETITETLELGRLRSPVIAQPKSLEAYDLYLLGRHHWYKRTKPEMQRALELFQQAVAADPLFAPAYSGISDASALLASWQFASPEEMYPKAVAAANRAIELDPSSADAHASLGFIKLNWEWDWDVAERELRRAIELNPNHETAHRWLSAFLAGIGKDDEAVRIARHAIDLDPISVLPRMNLGIVQLFGGRFEEAAAEFRRVIEADTGFVRGYMFLCGALSFLNRHEEAISIGRIAVEKAKQLPIAFVPLCTALARGGKTEEAHEVLNHIMQHGSDHISGAMAQAACGNESEAIGTLERGFESRSDWMYSLPTQPWFLEYHTNPRFIALLGRMNLKIVSRSA